MILYYKVIGEEGFAECPLFDPHRVFFTTESMALSSWTPTNNKPNHPHYMPNKKWNSYKRWVDVGFIFFDRMEFHMRAYPPMNFRPNRSGHNIITLTRHF